MSSGKPFVTVVSGVPRSGTSMMMQMLKAGGLPVLTDDLRTADEDNRKGYYELEAVKQTRDDSSWVMAAHGKAVKIIYSLLYDLPPDEQYRVLFMRRDLQQVVASQQEMLRRRDEKGADLPAEQMIALFQRQLDKVASWLEQAPNFSTLYVDYHQVLADPAAAAHEISKFLEGAVDAAKMAQEVDGRLNHQGRS